MKFNLLGLRTALGWLALACILGNQALYASASFDAIDTHNALVERVHANDNDRSQRSFTDLIFGIAAKASLSVEGEEKWEPNYLRMANPIGPFLDIDSWGTLNHILGWFGLALTATWFILQFAFSSEEEKPATLKVRYSYLYEPLLLEPFDQKIMTNATLGKKIVIQKINGFREYLKNARFWPVVMFSTRQYLLGAFGILLWVLILISITRASRGIGSDVIFLATYFALGVLVAANKHKYMFYLYRERGWTEELP